jgi:hypothetical protein
MEQLKAGNLHNCHYHKTSNLSPKTIRSSYSNSQIRFYELQYGRKKKTSVSQMKDIL